MTTARSMAVCQTRHSALTRKTASHSTRAGQTAPLWLSTQRSVPIRRIDRPLLGRPVSDWPTVSLAAQPSRQRDQRPLPRQDPPLWVTSGMPHQRLAPALPPFDEQPRLGCSRLGPILFHSSWMFSFHWHSPHTLTFIGHSDFLCHCTEAICGNTIVIFHVIKDTNGYVGSLFKGLE